MKRILLCLLCFMSLSAYAQHTVVVNPDGTHSTVIENGSNNTTALNRDFLDRVVVSAICAEPSNIFRDIPQQV